MVDITKIIFPKSLLSEYTVIQDSFDDDTCFSVKPTFPLAISCNSVVLKSGFKSVQEAEEWIELYKKDKSILKKEDLQIIEGLEKFNNFLNKTVKLH